jgi:hypothetical protein
MKKPTTAIARLKNRLARNTAMGLPGRSEDLTTSLTIEP